MKLLEYIEKLQALAQEHGDLELVYSVDDEGNYFRKVGFHPSEGLFRDNEFVSATMFEDYEIDNIPENINAICIN